jgi:CubicO group peptidase (beta-lactamase class C family)
MRRVISVVVGLLLLASCATTPIPPSSHFVDLEARIRAGAFGNVHSLLVMRGGALLESAYFSGPDERRGQSLGEVRFTRDTVHDARSITKTVVAMLYGVALEEGRVPKLDTPVIDGLPEYAALATPEVRRITIGHMLSMTSGFAWDEFTLPYSNPRNSESSMDASGDRVRYVFTRPIAHPPGSQWTYSGGDVAVIGRIIERGTGMSLHDYARRRILAPLGITRLEWITDEHGEAYAASGLRLLPRDLLKLGVLMQQNGIWRGRQVVPASWMASMTAAHATIGGPPPCGMRYGYFTWLSAVCGAGAPPAPYAAAQGYGGQRLVVFAEQNIIVATTAGNYADPQQTERASALVAAAFRAARAE